MFWFISLQLINNVNKNNEAIDAMKNLHIIYIIKIYYYKYIILFIIIKIYIQKF